MRRAQLLDQLRLLGLGPIALGERDLQLDQIAPQLELALGLPAQRAQAPPAARASACAPPGPDAQRAERMTVGRDQRRAGIEANLRIADDERVLAKAIVMPRVRDDEDLAVLNGVRAEGDGAGRLGSSRCRPAT